VRNGQVAGVDRLAGQNKRRKQAIVPRLVLPPPTNPMAVSRLFVEQHTVQGASCLRHWCGAWWHWLGTHWANIDDRHVRALLYRFTDNASYETPKGISEWLPTRHKIGDLLEALQSITILSDQYQQPCWLDGRESGPIVSVANGLLDIETRKLYAHTPNYFGTVSVPFNYEPDAPEPAHWLAFLGELWPQEPEAVDALGEWFGYTVSGRTNLHKILLMIGPTRGGKGATARVLTQLLGAANSCSPTLTSLGGEFGLAPLIGKSLAVIADARFNGKNAHSVVERLLSVSGEDAQTINRKYREQWYGRLGTRFFVISNELPQLPDASNALTGRFVILPLERSWLGKEDYGLEQRFTAELPGILNWALAGLERLIDNDNRFSRVEAADELVTTMRDLASPVSAFVRERCELGADLQIGVDDLYKAFRKWSEDNDVPRVSKAVFGRDLRAACPKVRKSRLWGGGNRVPAYTGLGLKKDTDGKLDL
jgi:putative DNA primase/helicase